LVPSGSSVRDGQTHPSQHYMPPISKLEACFPRVTTRTTDIKREKLGAIVRLHLVVIVGISAKIDDHVEAVDLGCGEQPVGFPLLQHAAPTDN